MPNDKLTKKKQSSAQLSYLRSLSRHRRCIFAARITILIVFLILWEISS